jgi:hypothetical protein
MKYGEHGRNEKNDRAFRMQTGHLAQEIPLIQFGKLYNHGPLWCGP